MDSKDDLTRFLALLGALWAMLIVALVGSEIWTFSEWILLPLVTLFLLPAFRLGGVPLNPFEFPFAKLFPRPRPSDDEAGRN